MLTFNKFNQRLADLEARPRQEAPRPTEAATRRTLQFLVNDVEAAELYAEALAVTSRLVCPHKRHGWCNPCIDATPTVGTAWQAVGLRMTKLESLHNPHTKEYTQ